MVAVIVMGVCGSGKTTVGKALAEKVSPLCPFEDADDHHSIENIHKMKQGLPLTDEDRLPWLLTLHGILSDWLSTANKDDPIEVVGVLACSALKRKYRNILTGSKDIKLSENPQAGYKEMSNILSDKESHTSEINLQKEDKDMIKQCLFVHLHGPSEVICSRMSERGSHFMPLSLLKTQLSILEEPLQGEEYCCSCDIRDSVHVIVERILSCI